MPDQPATSARIEDLKARVRLDPKSRHFYPLAEELRKFRRLDDAEKVLRDGLQHHGTYLSAWVSLGRVLQEKNDHRGAIDPLMKALALDPGNVVCARLLATSYLALGEKVEAIKKLKLVRALLPSDEDVEEQIQRLERELSEGSGPAPPAAPPTPAAPSEPESPPTPLAAEPAAGPGSSEREATAPSVEPEQPPLETARESWDHPFSSGREDLPEEDAAAAFVEEERVAAPAGPRADEAPSDVEAGPLESPFGEGTPAEVPSGGHWSPSEEPFGAPEPPAAAEPFDSSAEIEEQHVPAAAADERTATMTMGDLYARQGHAEAAKEIYTRLLDREPASAEVRQRLEALERSQGAGEGRPDRRGAVKRLEGWLDKVGRR